MTARIFESNGCAKLNNAQVIARAGSIGPMMLEVHNQSPSVDAAIGKVVVACFNERTGLAVHTDKDTSRTAEDTGYDGDGTDKTFSGQTLNNLPIVPGTLTVSCATGSSMPALTDTNADGKLYDPSANLCGTIDYFTGALTLSLSANTSAPANLIQLNAAYYSQSSSILPGGKKNFYIANVLQEDVVVVKAACNDPDGAFCKIDAVATWA